MPRVANEGPAVDRWYKEVSKGSEGSSTFDVCVECLDEVESTPTLLAPYQSQEPLGEWVDTQDHPPYTDEDYRCAICKKRLGLEDE